MNVMDIIYILLLLVGLAIGFFQGTIKLLITIIAFYVSIILASLYFQSLGNFYRQHFQSTLEVSQITAFATVLLVAFLLLTIAGLYTFRYARIPASLDFIDRIIGTILGLVLGAICLGMLSILLQDLFVAQTPNIDFPVVQALIQSIRTSFLVPFFSNQILPLIYTTMRPLLPRESDVIFRV